MHGSEIISISWIIFFILFAVVACLYADRDRNSNRIEWMKAVIFANIVAISIFGALTPEFIAYALNIPWRSNSGLNTTITVLGMITAWAIIQWAVEWLAALAALIAISGGLAWTVTRLMA